MVNFVQSHHHHQHDVGKQEQQIHLPVMRADYFELGPVKCIGPHDHFELVLPMYTHTYTRTNADILTD